ncbi:hypothetical protein ACFQX8_13415 [Klenkia terrae]|uniref:hypothetical protein n=1 Tax=Klenkia terrae TaxID=1052259 RepID=UPI0036180305
MRGSDTKSGPLTRTATVPSGATATTSWTTSAEAPEAVWVSRTQSTWPPGVTARSAKRTPEGMSGAALRGSGSAPGTTRYSRWSAKSVKNTVPPSTVHEPPPYSCTRVRAFHGSGSRSVVVPSAARCTSTVRPPSAARDSAHHTPSDVTATSPSRAAARTTSSDVMGVGQEP